jgi:Ca2+-binding RTX toxin-like protein
LGGLGKVVAVATGGAGGGECRAERGSQVATRLIEDPSEAKSVIEAAQPGDTLLLPDLAFSQSATIRVPSGVTVIGQPNTVIDFDGEGTLRWLFDLSGARGSSLGGFDVRIEGLGGVVTGNRFSECTLADIDVVGNFSQSTVRAEAPAPALYLAGGAGLDISGCSFSDCYGVIYVLDSVNVVIDANELTANYFGNIVVSGSRFIIEHNTVASAGISHRPASFVAQGDGITSFGLADSAIIGNALTDGFCYQMQFVGATAGVTIDGNHIRGGATNAIEFQDFATGIVITGNRFIQNGTLAGQGFGVVFKDGAKGVSLQGNVFDRDGLHIPAEIVNFGPGENSLFNQRADSALFFRGDDTFVGNAMNDRLDGLDGNDKLIGRTGNDTLFGGNGSDLLHGGAGIDVMNGGFGDDVYYVDAGNDKIVELVGQGIDSVVSTTTGYCLPAYVEHMTLSTGARNGVGNALDNWLCGNGLDNILAGDNSADSLVGRGGKDYLYGQRGNDVLVGGMGADLLYGGGGADIFQYGSATDGGDRIYGFDATDCFRLHGAEFGFVDPVGLIEGDTFFSSVNMPKPINAGPAILYSTNVGSLWWDGDGNGPDRPVLLTMVDGAPSVEAGDFVFF